jgi:CO/xanthine dehydrogenase Mo-binding subunit/aerobic-type carbon monoxide dehydrogenase small subunit (CoxS/CutS family)/thioredoxin reductase
MLENERLDIEMVVNGETIGRTVNPKTTLLRFLRDELNLVGTKQGCSTGDCGACSVLVNGKRIDSCLFLMENARGIRVETIEGITPKDGSLHPIQAAYLEAGAVQCGFCSPGMILATKVLLDRNPNPTEAEIREALNENICRCTGYVMIFEAVQLASKWLQNPEEFEKWKPRTGGLGASAVLADGPQAVTGKLFFADDLYRVGMVHGQIVWSKHPYAKILRVDTSEAEKAPGVVRVFTAKDVPGLNAHGRTRTDQQVFCTEVVRYTGDIIALVVAETKEQAKAAAKRVDVQYEVLQGVYNPMDALKEGAPQIQPHGPICKKVYHNIGDVDKALAEAALVVEGHFETQRIEHAYLEPHATLAEPGPDGSIIVQLPTQGPFETREQIANILAMPSDKVRVISTPVGGAYGGKLEVTCDAVAAVASYHLKRPVKITLTREEDLHNTVKRHPFSNDYKVGLDKDGIIVAVDAKLVADAGAYSGNSPRVIDQACVFAVGPYRCKNVRINGLAAFTNNPNSGPFRGYGINQANITMEQLLDEAAIKLNMDPFELRRKNMLVEGDYTIGGQWLFASVGAVGTLDASEKVFRQVWPEYEKRQRPGWKMGWGVAAAFKNVGAGKGKVDDSGATFTLKPDGRVEVRASVVDMGQSIRTTVIQLAAESTGISPELFDVITQDTAQTHPHRSASGERQTLISGRAVVDGGKAFKKKLVDQAAEWSGIDDYELHVKGDVLKTEWSQYRPDEVIFTLAEMGKRAAEEGISISASVVYVSPKTWPLSDQVAKKTVPKEQYRNCPTYAYATQTAIVEVEEATGKVDVLRVIAAHDVGKEINPQQIRGQIIGSTVQGMGFALSEICPSKDGLLLFEDPNETPCHTNCPVNMDIARFLELYKENRIEEAFESVIMDNPLPASTGRVCHHPCESQCRRISVDEATNIREVHRLIADQVYQNAEAFQRMKEKLASKKLAASGSKVAVWGAGPAGLTAAFYLALLGHDVTVYDAHAEAGGMLRYSIPEYRLPREVLGKEIELIASLSVKFVLNTRLGSDVSLDQLASQYKALFISVGTWKDAKLKVAGAELEGVVAALPFLDARAKGETVPVGENVVVIGGGSVATDAARSALRMGAKKVRIVCLESRNEMPATREEVEEAEMEGIPILNGLGPKQILGRDGKVAGVETLKTRRVFDEQGRFNPLLWENTESRIECDTVILAIGQTTNLEFLRPQDNVEVSARGLIVVDRESLATTAPGVFAGGDVVSGPSNVSNAMGYGKKAAANMDERLTGQKRFEQILPSFDVDMVPPLTPNDAPRHEGQVASACAHGFDEVNLGLTAEQALAEAGRCLRCDARVTYGTLGVPKAKDAPSVDVLTVEDPFPEGPYGAKGISEIAIVPSTPAILNAIYNATGVRAYKTPIERKLLKQAFRTAATAAD